MIWSLIFAALTVILVFLMYEVFNLIEIPPEEAGSEEAARGRMQTGAENTAARLAAVESEEAAAEAASALEATEAGVGLLFHGSGTARWAVKTIIPGSPAFLSGKIEEGDVLRAIGGDVVSDMETLKELSKHIMGRALHTCSC